MKILVWLDESSLQQNSEEEVAEVVVNALERIAGKVSRVTVSIRDTNGIKGGVDKLCRLTAHLMSGDVITLSDQTGVVLDSVVNASRRLQASVIKSLQRSNLHRNRISFADTKDNSNID